MKHFLLSAKIVITVLLFSACSGGSKTSSSLTRQGNSLYLHYAEHLKLVSYDDYTVATLRNPWDTLRTLHTYILVPRDKEVPPHLPAGTVVRTPLKEAVIYTSVHCSLLQQLGALDAVAGVCDLRYINLPLIQERCARGLVADCGAAHAPDVERIIDLHPDALFISPFENSGGYGRVEKLNIPLIECADYMETSLLGRAEWMRFYGLLLGVEQRADSLFAEVEARYLALKQRASQQPCTLSILPDLKTGGTWYMPGGRSYIGNLFQDAHIGYAFADDAHSGSVPMSFETVMDKAGDADIWLIRYNNPHRDMTYRDLAADFAGYTALKPFKERKVYGCNTARMPYYEEAPFRPDLLLNDYIRIFYPGIGDLGELRYFCPLEE